MIGENVTELIAEVLHKLSSTLTFWKQNSDKTAMIFAYLYN